MESKDWWKEAVVYQVYPRSFKDGNGDGVGDIAGIIDKVNYIKSLGVNAVWINPIYPSPNVDGGYDISDYTGIQPEFGDMHDFDRLVKVLHEKDIKLVMDLVLNHSSSLHPWFIESRKSKQNPYRDFYFWRPGKKNNVPNNWPSFFGGSAWEFDPLTEEYYLHLFSKEQPDLNWEHEPLRTAVKEIMRFWLDKGVDGLRLDVISAISKRTDFPDADTQDFNETIEKYYANGPRLKEFIAELKQVTDEYGAFTIGEGPGITPLNALDYLDSRNGLSLIFHFGHMFLDQGPGGRFDPVSWELDEFKNVFKKWNDAISEKGWLSIFLGNHDFARLVSRWGNDKDFHSESSKMLLTLLLTMPGTPFIFQGDEIGMTNLKLNSVSESKDIETLRGWEQAKQKISEEEFLKKVNYAGRDNARSPMQWDNSANGGFTTGKAWMTLNSNRSVINVANEEHDPDSILNYFRKMVTVRKENKILMYGIYESIQTDDVGLFLYYRILGLEKWLVALNFSSQHISSLFLNSIAKERLVGNYRQEDLMIIRPWEAVVFKVD